MRLIDSTVISLTHIWWSKYPNPQYNTITDGHLADLIPLSHHPAPSPCTITTATVIAIMTAITIIITLPFFLDLSVPQYTSMHLKVLHPSLILIRFAFRSLWPPLPPCFPCPLLPVLHCALAIDNRRDRLLDIVGLGAKQKTRVVCDSMQIHVTAYVNFNSQVRW